MAYVRGRMYLMSKLGLLKGLKCYQGCYKGGSACYTYRENAGEKILEGKFSYMNRSVSPFDGRRKKSACGTFAEGRKHGLWSYRLKSKRLQIQLAVGYRHGFRHGLYQATVGEESIPRWVRHRLCLTFVDGLPVGRVEAEVNGCTISGQCDAKGLPDGLWERLLVAMGDSQRCYYEVWENGSLHESYYILPQHRTTRYPCAPTIQDQLCFFVRAYCQPLERIVTGATRTWDGMLGEVAE